MTKRTFRNTPVKEVIVYSASNDVVCEKKSVAEELQAVVDFLSDYGDFEFVVKQGVLRYSNSGSPHMDVSGHEMIQWIRDNLDLVYLLVTRLMAARGQNNEE